MKNKIMTFLRDEEGLTIVEYAVAAGLIAAGAIGAFSYLGGEVSTVITALGDIIAGIDFTPAAPAP